LAVMVAFALARPSAALVRAIAAAFLVSQIPHFLYHAAHLDGLSSDLDRVLQTASLIATVAIPLLVFLAAGGIRSAPVASSPDRDLPDMHPTGRARLIARIS